MFASRSLWREFESWKVFRSVSVWNALDYSNLPSFPSTKVLSIFEQSTALAARLHNNFGRPKTRRLEAKGLLGLAGRIIVRLTLAHVERW